MAVFDGSIKTARRVKDPVTDKRVDSVASITMAAINTPAALLYPGTDVSVVHGDQQLHVDQNRIMKIGMNQNVTIGMNEIYLVDMNQHITVMQNYTRDIMMNSLINTTGNYMKNVLSNYEKNVTGSSSNTILGSYSKIVALNYIKTITGSSTNTITGTYSKTVQSNYLKHIQGTSTATIIGDYSKSVVSNYVKVVTGNSNVQVTSLSTVSYVGDHSRTFGNDHKMYISGKNTHTTVGPTIRTEIDVAVTQQIDNHVETHPTNLLQEKNQWFSIATMKGTWQKALKLDFTTGPTISGAIFKLDANVINYGVNGTTNAIFIDKFDCGGFKNEALAIKTQINGFSQRVGGATVKAYGYAGKACAATMHAGAASAKFLGGIFQAVPGKIQAGVTWAINQFM